MASRFWVGGTNTWDGTVGTKWAATSGGAGGVSVPTASDDVFFDANSGTGTITLGAVVNINSLNCTGYIGTFAHSSFNINVGSTTAGASSIAVKLVSGMAYSTAAGGTWTFVSTSATVQTIDFANKTLQSVTFSGTGGSWQLVGAMTTTTSSIVTHSAGTLDLNGQTCSWGKYATGGSSGIAKTLTMGASSVTLTITTGTAWDATVGNNLVVNAGTSTITLAAQTGAVTFAGNGRTYNNLNMTHAQTVSFTGADTWNNFTFQPTATGGNPGCVFQANPIINGLFKLSNADSGINAGRIVLAPAVFNSSNSQRTVTVNGSYSFNKVDFHCINAAGTATLPWTGTQMGDGVNNSNITFDAPRTLYWIATAGGNWQALASWSLTSGGTAANSAPLPQDNVIFDANSITTTGKTISLGLRFLGKDIDMSACPNSPIVALGSFNPGATGSFMMPAGSNMTASQQSTITLLGSGTFTPGSGGFGTNVNLTITAMTGGTYTLGADLTMTDATRSFNFFIGGFNANGYNLNIGNFTSSNSNTRTLTMGSGTWTINGASGSPFSIQTTTGLTLDASAVTLIFADTGSGTKNHGLGGRAFNNIQIAAQTGIVSFQGSSKSFDCNNLTIGAPNTVSFPSGTSNTITGNLSATGSGGNLIAIQSLTPGSQFTLLKTSGVISCNFLSLKDCKATGGAGFYAGANSVNVSNNSGWIFGTTPGNFMSFFN